MKRGEAGRKGPTPGGVQQEPIRKWEVSYMASEKGARSGEGVYLVRRVRRSEFEKKMHVAQSPTETLKRSPAIAPRRRRTGTAIQGPKIQT